MRGGAVSLAEQCASLATQGYRPDALLVSGMIDLPLFRALIDPMWGRLPTVLYLHETQLTYPDSDQLRPDLSYAFTNWASALVADRVVFNSAYHRDVFFSHVRPFLEGFPDHGHLHLVAAVEARSEVLPVGVDLAWLESAGSRRRDGPPLILWNHRWEHDKDPVTFLDTVLRLASDDMPFQIALCGKNARNDPVEFRRAAEQLGERVVWLGHADLDTYRELLIGADVVASTALQEFFGVAIVEAVAAGAFPVLPNRLAYPELVPAEFAGDVLYETSRFEEALRTALADPDGVRQRTVASLAPLFRRRFSWSAVIDEYDRLLATVEVETALV